MSNTLSVDAEPSVFRYGFMSSRTSEALREYLDKGEISERSKSVLHDAHDLLKDILSAQDMFGSKMEAAAPAEKALDAYGCALEVIYMNRSDFGVNDVKALSQLFVTLYETLNRLISISERGGSQEKVAPDPGNVEKTRMFFKSLSRLMLAHRSVPQEEHPM